MVKDTNWFTVDGLYRDSKQPFTQQYNVATAKEAVREAKHGRGSLHIISVFKGRHAVEDLPYEEINTPKPE